MSAAHFDILVAGGGIAGMATALSLARFGHPVHLVEQASEFREIGAGLQIGPNGTRALARLGLLEQLSAVAVHPRRLVVRDALTAEVLTSLDFGPKFLDRYGYPYLVAHRSDLLSILLDACREEPLLTLENNRVVSEVVEGVGHATVTFEDGEAYTANVLVGADGINSQVRQLINTTEPVFSGQFAYRGVIGIDEVKTEVAAQDIVLWIGPGIHLMQYPMRRGELYNQGALHERSPNESGTEDAFSSNEFDEVFSVACADVRSAITQLDRSRAWLVYDREPIPSWSTAHTVLVGDAAHAMQQYLGQGACQALEDALALATAVTKHRGDTTRAFRAYEDARVDVAHRCQRVARPWGRTWHTSDVATLALRNKVFRMRDPADYTDLDWLYAQRPDDPSVPPARITRQPVTIAADMTS